MRFIKRCFFVFLIWVCVPLAAAADEVVIGFSGPLSGPGAGYGQDCLSGIDMAISEINTSGGLSINGKTYRFRLERLDDRSDPTQAMSNANRFVAQYKTPVIFSPTSTTIGALARVNETPGSQFLIAAYSSDHRMHTLGNQLIINPTPDYRTYVTALADAAWSRGWRQGAMVVTLGAYGDVWRQMFKRYWEDKGGRILGDHPANYYIDKDFSSQLTAALATKPEFLLIGGPSATTALVVEQARGMGFKGGFILTDQARMDHILQTLGNGKNQNQMFGLANIADLPLPATEAFARNYVTRYKRPVTWEAAQHYTLMRILAKAMAQAATVSDPVAIRGALAFVLPTTGDTFPTELFGIEDNGVILSGGVIQSFEKGVFSKVEYLVSFPTTFEAFEAIRKLSRTREPENMRWLTLP